MLRSLIFIVAIATSFSVQGQQCATWPRALPPEGNEIPAERLDKWTKRLEELEKQLSPHRTSAYYADVAVLVKACRLALEFREFYQEKDFAKCDRLLDLAQSRMAWFQRNANEPTSGPLPGEEGQKRQQVRGFVSQVDDSPQPIGLVMPKEPLQSQKSWPLFVWLHGRGDKSTDLHFLCERMDKTGEVAPENAITLHPFGRQCVGYKSAGTTDVMEAIDFVCRNYPVDQRKIVLIGFSMGGAGAWHLAARNADRFVAVSPGAGFAETARYQNLKPDKYPPQYTQTLWSIYDVPDYTRNLFNLPVIAYSGENDKQIQAARVMEEAFQSHGHKLEHLIGPGMGHKYHPEVLKQLLKSLSDIADKGQPESPEELFLQTRHWRVHRTRWISIEELDEAYADTQVTARKQAEVWRIETKNVRALQFDPPSGKELHIDGSRIPIVPGRKLFLQHVKSSSWQVIDKLGDIGKRPGLSGPIDDAFFDPFMVVLPSGKTGNQLLADWCECESQYQISRWRSLMRGQPRVKRDIDVTEEDMAKYHLVLWGDAESNSLIARVVAKPTIRFTWNAKEIRLGTESWNATHTVPSLIMPSPFSAERYVVLNSGPTFRDAHDRTNSLQNPQLPDWAILDLNSPRTSESAGRVMEAGFFDNDWK